MLFFMGSASHLGTLGAGSDPAEPKLTMYWIVTLVIIGLVEFNGAYMGTGKPVQKHLTSVSGVITSGFVLTAVLYAVATYVL